MKLSPKVEGSILLAFSGGADSVVLLDLLLKAGYFVELLHLDHNLRETSKRDAAFCKEIAEEKGLTLHSFSIDVERYCQEAGLGIEEGARNLRYSLLRKTKEERNLDYIATGHHLDDQMETFFINLFRGSGSAGLGAMYPLRDDLYRPLLSHRKAEILSYVEDEGLDFVDDETNFETIYRRNQIRLELIPLIEKEYSPRLDRRLLQSTQILREEKDYIDEQLEKSLDLNKELFSLEEIGALHPVLKKALLRRKFSLNFSQIQEAMDILEERSHGEKIYKEGILRREQDYFYIGPTFDKEEVTFQLNLGKNTFGGYNIELSKSTKPFFSQELHSISEEMAKEGLVIRKRRPGDVFSPSGMKGTKKLKDFFVDEKIPLSQRDKYLLLASGKRVFWILGLRKSQTPISGSSYIQVLIEKDDELV